MNQIIFSEHENVKNAKNNIKKKFKLLLYISIISLFCVISYFLYSLYVSKQKENLSKNLLNAFFLERLYSNNSYTTIFLNNNEKYFVIGAIEIPSISINYPILSETNDELLKIAPCRFYGPYPNEEGNLCIAGHNYDDTRFFSNLYKLNIGNYIYIDDSKGNKICYEIYEKFEVSKNNTSSTQQNTSGRKELTLVTCNNFNGNRLIIKAKEVKNKGY